MLNINQISGLLKDPAGYINLNQYKKNVMNDLDFHDKEVHIENFIVFNN